MLKSKTLKSDLDDEMDYLENEEIDFFPDESEMNEMLLTVITGAISLTKLIIENRVRNSETLNDQDIYNIYHRSFRSVTTPMND